MKSPINYPCLILEREDYINETTKQVHFESLIINKPYSIAINEKDFIIKCDTFYDPVVCHYYSLINEAIILKTFNPEHYTNH